MYRDPNYTRSGSPYSTMPPAFNPANLRIGIIGLGCVGLPLAVESARKFPVVGFGVKQSNRAARVRLDGEPYG